MIGVQVQGWWLGASAAVDLSWRAVDLPRLPSYLIKGRKEKQAMIKLLWFIFGYVVGGAAGVLVTWAVLRGL